MTSERLFDVVDELSFVAAIVGLIVWGCVDVVGLIDVRGTTLDIVALVARCVIIGSIVAHLFIGWAHDGRLRSKAGT